MPDAAVRLADRAAAEGLSISRELAERLGAYYDLLFRWNRKINLTSLADSDAAIDRLLLEPFAAARHLPPGAALADLGSGGGSPAIPLALALGAARLLMIESRARKAVFLREAAREVQVDATVEGARFEEVSRQAAYAGQFNVVSLRAVRPERDTLSAAAALLQAGGSAALFVGSTIQPASLELPSNLAWRATRPLLRSTGSQLVLLFHVEHS